MTRTLLLIIAGAGIALGQAYQPGDFQATNPNYKVRNPFYFEGRVDWDLLKIDQPSNAWEFAQRGIHKQDDLEDSTGAIADYRQAVAMNSLEKGSCQVVKSAPADFGQTLNPPPCMFTVRLRLANLLKSSDPQGALRLLNEVAQIDPLRLGVNALMGEIYVAMGTNATNDEDRQTALQQAITAYQAELALSPVTALSKQLTGDEANNAHVHWALAGIYRTLGDAVNEASELNLYLKATKWHSDTYPWRIQLANQRIQKLQPASQ